MKKLFRVLDNLERKLQQYFWLPVSIIACSSFSFSNSNYYRSSSNLTPVTILEVKPKISVASTNAIAINGGDQSNHGKRKESTAEFLLRLDNTFPDWEERRAYEAIQAKFYASAMAKKQQFKQTMMKKDVRVYTDIWSKEELNAINYYQGTGVFQKYQNPNVKPNIYDTRKTFILKMRNQSMRLRFMRSYEELEYIDEKT